MMPRIKNLGSITKVLVLGAILCTSVNYVSPMSQQQAQLGIAQAQLNQIVQEVMKDKSPGFIETFFIEIEIALTSIVIGLATTAITNHNLFNQFWRAAMSGSETIMQIVARWNGGKIIKPIGTFILSTIISEILLKIISNHFLTPKDTQKESIKSLALLLKVAQKQPNYFS